MKTIAAYVVGCVSFLIWVALHVAEGVRAVRDRDAALGSTVMALCIMVLTIVPAALTYQLVQFLREVPQ